MGRALFLGANPQPASSHSKDAPDCSRRGRCRHSGRCLLRLPRPDFHLHWFCGHHGACSALRDLCPRPGSLGSHHGGSSSDGGPAPAPCRDLRPNLALPRLACTACVFRAIGALSRRQRSSRRGSSEAVLAHLLLARPHTFALPVAVPGRKCCWIRLVPPRAAIPESPFRFGSDASGAAPAGRAGAAAGIPRRRGRALTRAPRGQVIHGAPLPRIYVYDHCPFCVRARMIVRPRPRRRHAPHRHAPRRALCSATSPQAAPC